MNIMAPKNKIQEKRDEYIKEWNNYIDALYRLAFCSDKVLSDKIATAIQELKKLVPKVAETKTEFKEVQS